MLTYNEIINLNTNSKSVNKLPTGIVGSNYGMQSSAGLAKSDNTKRFSVTNLLQLDTSAGNANECKKSIGIFFFL